MEESDWGWHEGKNDPTPFIRYMLRVILSCYLDFEERVGLMTENGGGTAYDIVKRYVEGKVGEFTGFDVVACSPKLSRSSVLSQLKRLTDEGLIIRKGSGKNTFYIRAV